MRTPSETRSPPRTRRLLRVGLLGNAILMGGKFHPRLNIYGRPIAHKYRKGKVKRILKRKSKVLETAKRDGIRTVGIGSLHRTVVAVGWVFCLFMAFSCWSGQAFHLECSDGGECKRE